LEEFERASPQAQDSLKYVLEQYSGWCRFIFTTNNVAKISPAILSRCQRFEFNTLKIEDFLTRIVKILTMENISFDNLDIVSKYVQTYYPDLRACINAIDQHTIENKLQPLFDDDTYTTDKFNDIIKVLYTSDITTLKKKLSSTISNEEYEVFYQYLYNNLSLLGSMDKWDNILLIIAKYLYFVKFKLVQVAA
jgi:DNA polymerase III delta prime subunit